MQDTCRIEFSVEQVDCRIDAGLIDKMQSAVLFLVALWESIRTLSNNLRFWGLGF